MTVRARVFLMAAILVALLGLAPPAMGAEADLEATGSVISSAGDERIVRVTVTNLGPAEAYAGDDSGREPGDRETNLGVGLVAERASFVEAPPSCEDNPFLSNDWGDRICAPQKALAVGDSITVEARLRVTPPGRPSFLYGSASWYAKRYDNTGTRRSATDDPNGANNVVKIDLGGGPRCKVTAASPQRLKRRRLVLTVEAPKTRGCRAKLGKVGLRVGQKQRFQLLQPRSRTLKAGDRWRIELRLGTVVARALTEARRQGKNVAARAAFELDGEKATKEIVLR